MRREGVVIPIEYQKHGSVKAQSSRDAIPERIVCLVSTVTVHYIKKRHPKVSAF